MATWNDLRQATRTLWREPGFAAVSVLTLALGIGANTAIFSIVNGVLLRPLEYREPERLMALREVFPAMAQTYPTIPVSACHFTEWRNRSSSFESLSLLDPAVGNLTGSGEPERLEVIRVSANLFDTLGVRPRWGRGFLPGEDQWGRDRVVVISESLWRRRFHADPALIGRTVTLDGENHVVVGVLAAGFRFPAAPSSTIGHAVAIHPDIYKPKAFPQDELAELIGMFNYDVIGRLKPGVSREQAVAELNVLVAQIVKRSGEKIEMRAVAIPLRDSIVGASRRGLLVLLGAVGSVLLIVCLNLANLALARAERRGRESAIRTALGASRGRLVPHALIESLLIALVGGVLGVAVASAGLGALVASAPVEIPRLESVTLDARVFGFALAITALTGILFGLAPAWRAASADPQQALKAGGRTASVGSGAARLRGALVAAEVGLGTVLLVTATLLMGSFTRLMRADKGFQAPAVLAADVSIPWSKYSQSEQRNAFHDRVLAQLRSQAGVRLAAISTALPLQGETWVDSAVVPGDSRPMSQRPVVNVRFVSPDYFRTMGIPMRAGRTFSENDRTRKVAIVSEGLAGVLWPGQDPVGRKLTRGGDDLYEVIGVVGDVRAEAHKAPVAMVYRTYWEWAPRSVVLVARAEGDPRSITGAVRAAVRAVDADVPVAKMRTMQQILEDSVATRRFQMTLAAVFAGTALLLAGLGIYGVVSYSVARRTNEMGIRMALGAESLHLYGMVLRQGMAPVALGLVAGVAGSLAAGRVLASLFYEICARDPLTIGAVAILLTLVALAACTLPARRATRVDPLVALHYE